MTDDPPFDPLFLDRYLTGDLSSAERAQVEAWLSAHPVAAQQLQEMPRVLLGDAQRADTDVSWQRLSARIGAVSSGDDLSDRRAHRAAAVSAAQPAAWLRRVAAIAAALVVVIGSAAIWRGTRDRVLVAPLGHDVTATLPDGSRLTLSAGSRATWSRHFNTHSRDITLDGEGMFDVVHEVARPFRVTTRNAVAEDIGTRFVVRAWPELASVEVAVEEGLVALTDTSHVRNAQTTVLRAGQRGRLMQQGRVEVTTDADVALAWTRGQLVFDNQPLGEVLPAISRRFDVEMRADRDLDGRRLTARFPAQSLREVLDALALSLDVRVVASGRTYTLTPVVR